MRSVGLGTWRGNKGVSFAEMRPPVSVLARRVRDSLSVIPTAKLAGLHNAWWDVPRALSRSHAHIWRRRAVPCRRWEGPFPSLHAAKDFAFEENKPVGSFSFPCPSDCLSCRLARASHGLLTYGGNSYVSSPPIVLMGFLKPKPEIAASLRYRFSYPIRTLTAPEEKRGGKEGGAALRPEACTGVAT